MLNHLWLGPCNCPTHVVCGNLRSGHATDQQLDDAATLLELMVQKLAPLEYARRQESRDGGSVASHRGRQLHGGDADGPDRQDAEDGPLTVRPASPTD